MRRGKYYGSLASAFEKAVHWELIKENPFRKVKKPKSPEVMPLFFSEAEFNTLISNVQSKDFRELCISALLTGLRLDELLHLCCQDIDFSSKLILIRNTEKFTTKTRKNRIVPMSDELFRLLREKKENIRNESAFVFHNKKGKPLRDKPFRSNSKNMLSGLELMTNHTLTFSGIHLLPTW